MKNQSSSSEDENGPADAKALKAQLPEKKDHLPEGSIESLVVEYRKAKEKDGREDAGSPPWWIECIMGSSR